MVSNYTMESICQFRFDEMIRIFFNMGNGEVYGKFVNFVLALCVVNFDFYTFVCLSKTTTASLVILGIIKNIILGCSNFCD